MRLHQILSLSVGLPLAIARPVSADPPENLLTNGSFETEATARGITNKQSDKVDCNGDVTAHEGVCVFRLKGGGPAAQLKQSVSAEVLTELNAALGCAPITMLLRLWVSAASVNRLTPDVAITLRYTSFDNETHVKIKTQARPIGSADTWVQHITRIAHLDQYSTISELTVKVADRNTSGKTYIDDASVGWVYILTPLC